MRRSSSHTNWLPWGLGLGALGLVFFATKKSATGGAADAPGGKTRVASVLQDVRTRRGAGTGNPTIAPDRVSPNDALKGTKVQVIRTGLPGTGALEWWEIITPGGGRGFAAAKNTDETINMKLD